MPHLRPGGLFISTFPIQRTLVNAVTVRTALTPDSTIIYHKEAEYHGNPISGDGSLVTVDYGYDIHEQICSWADFDIRICAFPTRPTVS